MNGYCALTATSVFQTYGVGISFKNGDVHLGTSWPAHLGASWPIIGLKQSFLAVSTCLLGPVPCLFQTGEGFPFGLEAETYYNRSPSQLDL